MLAVNGIAAIAVDYYIINNLQFVVFAVFSAVFQFFCPRQVSLVVRFQEPFREITGGIVGVLTEPHLTREQPGAEHGIDPLYFVRRAHFNPAYPATFKQLLDGAFLLLPPCLRCSTVNGFGTCADAFGHGASGVLSSGNSTLNGPRNSGGRAFRRRQASFN